MDLLDKKRVLIVGLASERSIACGIARAMKRQGAELAFTYQNERLKERVIRIAEEFGSKIVLPCDVSQDESLNNLFTQLSQHWNSLDVLVHSVAYAPGDQLTGDYLACVNREGFQIAHDVSSYSLAALAKILLPLMEGNQAAILTLSYLGSLQVVPHYNVMGLAKASLEANVRYLAHSLGAKKIRVNAISAGPIRTLAASGIKDFRKILTLHEELAPLHENTTLEQVGNTAAFLCSNLASGITGEIIHVDGGFHIMSGIFAAYQNISDTNKG
jgi:enoyl-[acyl-carrier protein] reductase I